MKIKMSQRTVEIIELLNASKITKSETQGCVYSVVCYYTVFKLNK